MRIRSRHLLAASLACGAFAVAQAADTPNRVVNLHYDYMAGPGASHAPDARAIAIVVEAFRRQGIALVIDPVHVAIPARAVVTFPAMDAGFAAPQCAGDDAESIEALRATYLGERTGETWHYAVFADRAICPDAEHCARCPPDAFASGEPGVAATGAAQMRGDSFVVEAARGTGPRSVARDAAALMHMLGHNLGLHHGGDETTDRKPNYVSVMNHSYVLTGIPVAGRPGSSVPRPCIADRNCGARAHCLDLGYCARVDYSAEKLASLYEGALDAAAGVGGNSRDTDIVVFFEGGDSSTSRFAAVHGPIEWNGAGSLAGERAGVDINADGHEDVLSGFDDWSAVRAYLDTPEYRGGVRKAAAVVRCVPGR